MNVSILKECGFYEAMLGLSLSYNKDHNEMPEIAKKLAPLGKGHNKFLESVVVWLDITAPIDWWIQFDTYRVGVTKQSESTMHTLTKKPLTQEDFECKIPESYLSYLNSCIDGGAPVEFIKKMLPCGFLQRRIVCTNYKTIQNILVQRGKHKLPEWKVFCEVMKMLEYYEYIS